jgi:hypothetical protein
MLKNSGPKEGAPGAPYSRSINLAALAHAGDKPNSRRARTSHGETVERETRPPTGPFGVPHRVDGRVANFGSADFSGRQLPAATLGWHENVPWCKSENLRAPWHKRAMKDPTCHS